MSSRRFAIFDKETGNIHAQLTYSFPGENINVFFDVPDDYCQIEIEESLKGKRVDTGTQNLVRVKKWWKKLLYGKHN